MRRGLECGNDTSRSTGRGGRQNAATRRNMRREERVTVQGPVKKQQPDGMAHGGVYSPPPLKSVLGSANPRTDLECASGCTGSTARATAPSLGRPTPGVVKQDKSSGGSVDTTKTRSGPRRVRMSGGERPIGAAKGKQSDTEALCQPPPRTRISLRENMKLYKRRC